MNTRTTIRAAKRALQGLPAAETRRDVIVSAGWWLTTQQSHEGDSVAVCYKNPSAGTDSERRTLITSCRRALTDALSGDFKVEEHEGDFGADCPTCLLGRHVHILDK